MYRVYRVYSKSRLDEKKNASNFFFFLEEKKNIWKKNIKGL